MSKALRSLRATAELPTTYTCSMTRDEAAERKEAASHFHEIKFEILGTTDEGRVVGQTTVESMDSFQKYSEMVNPRIPGGRERKV